MARFGEIFIPGCSLMVGSFKEILAESSIFLDRNVLLPHYIPAHLPHREKYIEKVMRSVSPALQGAKPRNLFIYGKVGTGKTCCVKHVMQKFEQMESSSKMTYINCRVYNSRYKIFQKIVKDYIPEQDKPGFGLQYFYENIVKWVEQEKRHLIVVLDEIDVVHDLNELVYNFTRANDDLKAGGISILGISNKLSFKERLDNRSKSALYETELVFPPYNANQLQEILIERVKMGYANSSVDEAALNLASAVAAQETGDARYALKLILRAGELVLDSGRRIVTESDVEQARKSVDEDVITDAISTLPEHQQMVLYSVANLAITGGRYSKLAAIEDDGNYLMSGEVYEGYLSSCSKYRKRARSMRWFQEYLGELEVFGLISMLESGQGVRGRSRLIKIGYSPERVKGIIEKNFNGGYRNEDSKDAGNNGGNAVLAANEHNGGSAEMAKGNNGGNGGSINAASLENRNNGGAV
ncbi:ORC1-type DNA replication protein [Candidatus Gugararchaeum adminiculabundum]|nr:ORC1-type DNA replication protein [Candidatus Gugararchaeum adminiculabundum]